MSTVPWREGPEREAVFQALQRVVQIWMVAAPEMPLSPRPGLARLRQTELGGAMRGESRLKLGLRDESRLELG
jgi:hypothetical protein